MRVLILLSVVVLACRKDPVSPEQIAPKRSTACAIPIGADVSAGVGIARVCRDSVVTRGRP